MKDGFIKVAAVTPRVYVAAPEKNVKEMVERAEEMSAVGVKLLLCPVLSTTGYTCGDLFLTHVLWQKHCIRISTGLLSLFW